MNERTESENLNELFTALCKAQGAMEEAKKDSANPYFKSKYADLSSVIAASRETLSANGLCIIQHINPDASGVLQLSTRLGHTSGQWMESRMAINPPKGDIQSIGSYITYLRRYCYASLVGVATCDDDGESAMQRPFKKDDTLKQMQSLLDQLSPDRQEAFCEYIEWKKPEELEPDKLLEARSFLEKAIRKLNTPQKEKTNES